MTEILPAVARHGRPFAVLAVLALGLSSCATVANGPSSPATAADDYGALMAVAETHAAAGDTEAAAQAFELAAASEPANKQPWLRLAQLRADNGQPALALLAAGEVLQRDPSDTVASGVYLASGLQIALGTLQRLRASDTERKADHRPQAQALLEALVQIYSVQELLPEEVSRRIAEQAIEQWKQKNPQRASEAPPASPLDILGGD